MDVLGRQIYSVQYRGERKLSGSGLQTKQTDGIEHVVMVVFDIIYCQQLSFKLVSASSWD